MPYLDSKRKQELNNGAVPVTLGDLTYRLTLQMLEPQQNRDTLTESLFKEIDLYLLGREVRYEQYAGVLGCLTATAQEFGRRRRDIDVRLWVHQFILENYIIPRYYREVVAPYEDKKIEQNGDVYV